MVLGRVVPRRGGRQMRHVPHQVTHFHLGELVRFPLRGVVADAGGIRVEEAGLLGADLEFGDGEGVVLSLH
ncbi:hypothetical protein D3C85_1140720 [compost metagenome]